MKLVIFIMLLGIFQCSLLYDAEQLEEFPDKVFGYRQVKKQTKKDERKLHKDNNEQMKKQSASNLHTNVESIEKIFNLQQVETLTKGLKCNDNILKAFGIIDDMDKVQPATAEGSMRRYCRKNRFTCCSTKQLQKASQQFTQFQQELVRSFDIVEQMLYVFRGPKVQDLLTQINDTNLKHKCQNVILNDFYYGDLNQFEDFINRTLPQQLNKIEQLLEDTQLYVKKVSWFYSNLHCAACSPFLSQEFQMNSSGATLNFNNSTCQELIDLHEYEYRLVIVYESFIKPIVRLIDCVYSEENEHGLLEELHIENINLEVAQMVEKKEDFYECFQNFVPTEPNCLEICQKQKITHYEFPVKIFNVFKNVNKVLFQYFVNEDLEEYYEKVMGYDIHSCCNDEPIPVLKQTEAYKIFKMESADLKYDSSEGIRVFQEQMGKAFQRYEEKGVKVLKIMFVTIMAIFI